MPRPVAPVRPACTQANDAARQLTVRPQAVHEAIQAARPRQATAEFSVEYARRAGMEGPQTQAIRRCGPRWAWYRGLAKTRLQRLITAVALNVARRGECGWARPWRSSAVLPLLPCGWQPHRVASHLNSPPVSVVPSVVLSTPHGVLNDSGPDRYSIALFYSPNVASVLECLPSCTDPGDPSRDPPAVYRDLALDFSHANDLHREGDAAERAS